MDADIPWAETRQDMHVLFLNLLYCMHIIVLEQ